MKRRALGFLGVAMMPILLASSGCFSSSSSGSDSAPVNVTMAAEYGAGATRATRVMAAVPSGCPGVTATDEPAYLPGDDCDGDGGEVSFLTPANFTVALKRLTFVTAEGDTVDLVPDSGTLANATRIDLTTPQTIAQDSIPVAHYVAALAEIYYFEITMPLNNAQTDQTIRVYMSDDDFAAEGSLHHHQGDITLVDDTGTELGWVGVNTPWTVGALQTDPDTLLRPGGIDAETGHQRGHFGNAALWDQEAFVQGAEQDIFVLTMPIDLNLATQSQPTVTFTFDVADTWFWEDFDADGYFDPCEDVVGGNSDACVANAEWAPLFNPPTATIE